MALFTDCAVTSIEDLRGHDTQLLSVASIEGIDVTRKLGLAHEELAIELEGLLDQLRPAAGIYEVAAMLGGLNSPPAIRQVVATPPLKLWHIYRTLEMVYADAYNSQLNDRYAGKRDEYHEMAGWAHDKAIQSGLGIAMDPVDRATMPSPQASAGALADGTYYVSVSWTNAKGEEGAVSIPAVIAISGSSFEVQTTAPANVKGWNVYSGTSQATMTRQNSAVLVPGQSWVQPDTLATAGQRPGDGQKPTYRLPVPRTIQRG